MKCASCDVIVEIVPSCDVFEVLKMFYLYFYLIFISDITHLLGIP